MNVPALWNKSITFHKCFKMLLVHLHPVVQIVLINPLGGPWGPFHQARHGPDHYWESALQIEKMEYRIPIISLVGEYIRGQLRWWSQWLREHYRDHLQRARGPLPPALSIPWEVQGGINENLQKEKRGKVMKWYEPSVQGRQPLYHPTEQYSYRLLWLFKIIKSFNPFKFHAYHMYQRSPSKSPGIVLRKKWVNTVYHHCECALEDVWVSKYRNKRLDDLPNDKVSLCQVLKHLKVTWRRQR